MIDDYDQDTFFLKTERFNKCLSTRSVETVFIYWQLLLHIIDIVKLDPNLNIPNKWINQLQVFCI